MSVPKTLILKVEIESFLMVIIITLVGLAGFGLGRLSNAGEGKAIIIQTESSQNLQTNSVQATLNTASVIDAINGPGSVVASKNGTKYYFSWCGGVGRIQDQNKIYFTSEQEAIEAGYSKASGCK